MNKAQHTILEDKSRNYLQRAQSKNPKNITLQIDTYLDNSDSRGDPDFSCSPALAELIIQLRLLLPITWPPQCQTRTLSLQGALINQPLITLPLYSMCAKMLSTSRQIAHITDIYLRVSVWTLGPRSQ